MRLGTCLALALCTWVGCSSSEVEQVQPTTTETVLAIDAQGHRQLISLSEIFDDKTGKPLVTKVYCVDRRDGKKVWVDPKALKQRDRSSSYLVPIRE